MRVSTDVAERVQPDAAEIGNAEVEAEVDVVVVGAGVAGLWITRELRRAGWSVALLARIPLGGDQTHHSHVYLHRGHLYRREAADAATSVRSIVSDLLVASHRWDEWLGDHVPPATTDSVDAPGPGPAPETPIPYETCLFGFRDEDRTREVEALWDAWGLVSVPAPRPSVMAGSFIGAVRSVQTRALNATWMSAALADDCAGAVMAVDSCAFDIDDVEGVGSVTVTHTGRRARIGCRLVVLSGGLDNGELLGRVSADAADGVEAVARPSFMLAVRGPRDVLEPFTGVLSISEDDGLFIVSRTVGSGTVWLVSDACRQAEVVDWVPMVVSELELVFPVVMAGREHLAWAVYDAPKAEVRAVQRELDASVPSVVVRDVGPNAVAVWPIKLTLAPVAALEVLDWVDRSSAGVTPRPQPDLAAPDPLIAAPERWQTVEPVDWASFATAYSLA